MGRGKFRLPAGRLSEWRGIMARLSDYVIGGLAVTAVMLGALPAAQGIGTATKRAPAVQVNRAAKGDRLVGTQSIAVKRPPAETARDTTPILDPAAKRQLMDGCEPMFSPVTVPSMAHIAGRCVG